MSELALSTARPGALAELSAIANREHNAAMAFLHDAVQHAVAAGDALLAARAQVERGGWELWLSENFDATTHTAYRYMRLARYRERLPQGVGVRQALDSLVGQPAIRESPTPLPITRSAEVKILVDDGWSRAEIAAALGVCTDTVKRLEDPAVYRRRVRQEGARRRAATRALRRARIENAARETGGSVAEAYSLVRKLAQELERAIDGTNARDVRASLSRALSDTHRAEDDIVRALGIS